MDPNAELQIAFNEDADPDERAAAAARLLGWLDRGGFAPETKMNAALVRELEYVAFYGFRYQERY